MTAVFAALVGLVIAFAPLLFGLVFPSPFAIKDATPHSRAIAETMAGKGAMCI